MKKTINKTHIEGYIYQHNLALKTSGPNSAHPGTEFISGDLEIATDNALLNIVPVHFTYVTATTSSGKPNATFEVLNNIINGTVGNVVKHGADKAGKVRIDSAIGLNEFYSDRNGPVELVSVKRNEGGFVHLTPNLNENEDARSTFECDMLITHVIHKEADPDNGTEEKGIIKGYTFDFRNALLPIELSVYHPGAIAYFENLGASEKRPVFTKVWGKQISATVKRMQTIEGAWGDEVRETTSVRKDFVIANANKEVYAFGDEGIMTEKELTDALAKREIDLADMKKRQEEYKASRGGAINTAAPAAVVSTTGGFNF